MSKITVSSSILLIFYALVLCLQSSDTDQEECKPGQCENNGFCFNGTCLCAEGWTGSHCQFCDGRFRFVVVVIIIN